MERHWAEAYVGTPYSECDCLQLCVRVQRRHFKRLLNIPSIRPSGLRGASEMLTNMQDDFAIRIDQPEEGDAVLMIGRGRINHVGVACYVNDQLHVLHAMRNVGMACLHNINSLSQLGLKVEGYYQWK